MDALKHASTQACTHKHTSNFKIAAEFECWRTTTATTSEISKKEEKDSE